MIVFPSNATFVVTGASTGIGLATARLMIELGAKVIAVARTEERLAQGRATVSSPDRFISEVRDLGNDIDGLPDWVRQLSERHGPLRGVVHSAGAYEVVPLRVLSLESSRKLFELNYFAALALAKGFARKSVSAGPGSSLTFLSSISSIRGFTGVTAYSATKGAINAMVRSLAAELARQGIRVNAVMPGVVDTEMTRRAPPEQTEYLVARQPLGMVQSVDVAQSCAFLASDAARFITGHCLAVDGGGSV